MLARLRPRLTYANVISTLCLFILLGGGAYAAFKLPKNSVGTKQLKNGAVTNRKLARNAVSGSKVRAGSLTGADINASTLGRVPNASRAADAGHAANSDQLDGLLPSAFFASANATKFSANQTYCTAATGSCSADVISLGGLTLHADCSQSGSSATLALSVVAADPSNTLTTAAWVEDAGGATPGAHHDVVAGSGALRTFSTTNANASEDGTIIASDDPSGTVVSVPTRLVVGTGFSMAFCNEAGTAIKP